MAVLLGVARPCAEVGKEIRGREGWEKVKQLSKALLFLLQPPVLALVGD